MTVGKLVKQRLRRMRRLGLCSCIFFPMHPKTGSCEKIKFLDVLFLFFPLEENKHSI